MTPDPVKTIPGQVEKRRPPAFPAWVGELGSNPHRHIDGPNRSQRRARGGRHAFIVTFADGRKVLIRMTGRRPWTVKAERRAAGRRARAARKANR